MNDEKENIMNETTQPVYFFNPVNGDIYLSEAELPPKKSRLFLVINRELLFFRMFSIAAKKKMKDSHILNIQRHFIPFNEPFLNIIYSNEKQLEKKYFSWVGREISSLTSMIDVKSYFYDEVPESLLFKGNPAQIRDYRFFVFKRMTGYEIIYLNDTDFYSLFEKDISQIWNQIIALIRKFPLTGTDKINVLTEVDPGALPEKTGTGSVSDHYDINMDFIADNAGYFFLPDYAPLKKKFSNISENKQLSSMKNIIRRWNRHLNIVIFLLLLALFIQVSGFISLKKDNARFTEQFAGIQNILDASERIEFQLNRMRQKISTYPDHLQYLDIIAGSLGDSSMLIGYALSEGKILLEGYSDNSLELLERLRKSNLFQEVKFASTVTKNVYSQREKFEIEIILANEKTSITKSSPTTPAEQEKGTT